MPIPAAPTSPRVSAWEWAQTGLLSVNLIWTTLGRGGFPTHIMLVTSALTVALLVVHFLAQAFGAVTTGEREGRVKWFLVPFIGYAVVNVLWVSPVRWIAWSDLWGWAQLVAVFWVVVAGIRSPAPQRALFSVLILLGVMGVVLACYQCFVNPDWQMLGGTRMYYRGRGSGSFGMPNSLAAYLALLLPVVAALAFRRRASAMERVWWGWVGAAFLLGLGLTISRGAWAALGLAVIFWPLGVMRSRWSRRLRYAAATLVGVAAVGLIAYASSPTIRARLNSLRADSGERTRPIMWRAAWGLFREHPTAGTGAGSYDVLFEKYRPERFSDRVLWAHNDYLNTLSDYGVVGFVLFFGAAALVVVACFRIHRDEAAPRRDALDSPTVRGGIAIGLLAFALHLGIEFHLKIPALALAVAVMAGIAVTRTENRSATMRPPSRIHRVGAAVVALGCVAAYAGFFLPRFRAENLRQHARQALDALANEPADFAHYHTPVERARVALKQATALDPANGQAWADLAYASALRSIAVRDRDVEFGRDAEAAADQALARSPGCFEFWLRRGVARDMQARWAEANTDFAAALERAPRNKVAWYYYAIHLSRVPAAHESAEAAVEFCLRLDPYDALALALRQRLAIKQIAP